jgi:AcrR family transcriptional regulator
MCFGYYLSVARPKAAPGKRPYSLGKRLERSDHKRTRILAAARTHLESNGFQNLTLDALARESGVTRQTIHNLFGTKAGLLEALFDQLALAAGMDRMREVMQKIDADTLLPAFVKVFTDFWSKDRLFVRRIHGIAAIDPELGVAVEARNRRRQMAAARVVERLSRGNGARTDARADLKDGAENQVRQAASLYALTSFEFFDALAQSLGTVQQAADLVLVLVKRQLPTR